MENSKSYIYKEMKKKRNEQAIAAAESISPLAQNMIKVEAIQSALEWKWSLIPELQNKAKGQFD